MIQDGNIVEINGQKFIVLTVEYYQQHRAQDKHQVKYISLVGIKEANT